FLRGYKYVGNSFYQFGLLKATLKLTASQAIVGFLIFPTDKSGGLKSRKKLTFFTNKFGGL
ncbi:MAG TPA: hypothetical protein V6C90_26845, partial [Coleofasciculaceae cyanobacterium]